MAVLDSWYWLSLQTTVGVSIFANTVNAFSILAGLLMVDVLVLTSRARLSNYLRRYAARVIIRFIEPLIALKALLRLRVSWQGGRPAVRRLTATRRERTSERFDAKIPDKIKLLVRPPMRDRLPTHVAFRS
jgi:hypothetical protein